VGGAATAGIAASDRRMAMAATIARMRGTDHSSPPPSDSACRCRASLKSPNPPQSLYLFPGLAGGQQNAHQPALISFRKRKNRCSQTLQRKGIIPILVSTKSNSRLRDLRTFDSRHFGQVIAMDCSLLRTWGSLRQVFHCGLRRQKQNKAVSCLPRDLSALQGDTNMMLR